MIRLQAPTIAVYGDSAMAAALCRYLGARDSRVTHAGSRSGSAGAAALNAASTVFLCPDTGSGFDASGLRETVRGLRGGKTIVVACRVLPGITDSLQRLFPRQRFLFLPPPLAGEDDYGAFAAPDRQVVGYTAESRTAAAPLLAMLPRAPYERLLPAAEAEIASFVAGGLLALKAAFAAEIAGVCDRLGLEFERVAEIVNAEPAARAFCPEAPAADRDVAVLLDLASHLGVAALLLRTIGPAPARPRALEAIAPDAPSGQTERAA